jgi:hypothetical protein
MKVGNLVSVTLHTDTTMLGLVEKINHDPIDHVDSMFPYLVYFNDNDYSDWFGLRSLEVISESR